MPGAEVDTNDIWIMLWKLGGNIVFKVYDQSANSWSADETILTPTGAGVLANAAQMSAAQRHSDNHVFLVVYPAGINLTAANLRVFDIAGSGQIYEGAILKDSAGPGVRHLSLTIDQAEDAIYAAWQGDDGTNGYVDYAMSKQSARYWRRRTAFTQETRGYIRLSADMSIRNGDAGRLFFAVLSVSPTNTVWTNLGNSFDLPSPIEVGAPIKTEARAIAPVRSDAPLATRTPTRTAPADP